MPQETTERPLTTAQAAEILHVAPATIINYADKGLLRYFRLPSGHRRFWRADVEAFLDPEQAA